MKDGEAGEYNPWGRAKSELINEIGSYCSYCEKKVNRSSLHIEHVLDKMNYDNLKYKWDNFLLACCNCNSIKAGKNVALTNPFLPHQNNLVHFIEVDRGGCIKIKNGVVGSNLNRTIEFIDLVGLDREPGHPKYKHSDDRWENRMETKDLAERQFCKYTSTPKKTDLETIITLAKEKGFFSVWYYQFSGYSEVLDALINGILVKGVQIEPFKGTHIDSFEAPSYKTLERP